MNASAQLLIIGTGGTIAGAGASPELSTRYEAAKVPIAALAGAVPGLADHARLSFAQPVQKASYEIDAADWQSIRRAVIAGLADPALTGVVITHGTDTLEETAFLLHHSLNDPRPVVLTGAMRPGTAHSPDGPANVFNAAMVALNPASRDRGVLVVMNERIHSAAWVGKRHFSSVEAFSSASFGELGSVADGQACFHRAHDPSLAARPVLSAPPDVALPRVAVVFGHSGGDADTLAAIVASRPAGLVYAGTGNGNIPLVLRPLITQAIRDGIVVVRSGRGLEGTITRNSPMLDDAALGTITAGRLPPQKARVLLMLALACGTPTADLQGLYDRA
ncbi:MAG: asparaginase [Burkholderiaceae bacterium]|nr:asparaginase [Burkholderiaceae bacterium]